MINCNTPTYSVKLMNTRRGCSGSNGQVPHPLRNAYHNTAVTMAMRSTQIMATYELARVDPVEVACRREARGVASGNVRKRNTAIGVAMMCSAGTNDGILPV